MKLNSIYEGESNKPKTLVWQPAEEQGKPHKKHWYQKYIKKIPTTYTWPRTTGLGKSTGYKEAILKETKMPFKVKGSKKKGYKVYSPSGPKSKKSMSKEKARRQQSAIYANWKGESLERKIDKAVNEIIETEYEIDIIREDMKLIEKGDNYRIINLGEKAYNYIIDQQSSNKSLEDTVIELFDSDWQPTLYGRKLYLENNQYRP